ncbi:hypothetical protein A3H81_03880 [Candidatus Daviesbacteria bacterium RIFCSPLOWO2_02_FULL_38_18]|uniref:Type II secretion system protein GspG C-terminal domain-containing protein n=1 Tax=Candidatus Daviesbacteria bacterium GW2011_GWF2_38_6 TaxID=1618432 RepID=A0A0G0KF71_9BACT|nr:MAG: hypothetical protein US99_C0027G0007 [Candidatus Daviesbacteria bacterium GW2011_GWF2_38_6]OGE67324.1 MAG: hypothetical protein A3H81_03880 [Candidatus Daviesbacteria bacterium RIFCSPLOWO2_02_FULL_38_18]OGE73072.1 MAG: hypothetical protein A3H18_00460 [Candidatus Daviesbacteria bacterium RIFCSPLOWO2_12_FULL_38_10]
MLGQSTVRKGFTLIELLIVISIISILSAIGMVAYSSVVRQGRDSKRQSDLRSIQSALEQYHNDQGFYPTGAEISFGGPFTPYMNTIPTDPTGTPQYSYTALPSGCDNSATKCNGYCLYAKLENSNPGIGSCPVSGTANFAVTPP